MQRAGGQDDRAAQKPRVCGSLEFLRLLNSLKLDREPRRRVAELAIRNQALFVST